MTYEISDPELISRFNFVANVCRGDRWRCGGLGGDLCGKVMAISGIFAIRAVLTGFGKDFDHTVIGVHFLR